jgi:serine/threonine protein kinase
MLKFDGKEWEKISKLGKDILRRMLHKNPEERISAKECLLHPWFYNNIFQTKKRIKSSADIDLENEKTEQFYEKNQHYKCNTLKEYILEASK